VVYILIYFVKFYIEVIYCYVNIYLHQVNISWLWLDRLMAWGIEIIRVIFIGIRICVRYGSGFWEVNGGIWIFFWRMLRRRMRGVWGVCLGLGCLWEKSYGWLHHLRGLSCWNGVVSFKQIFRRWRFIDWFFELRIFV
jgi:hypothetical protein